MKSDEWMFAGDLEREEVDIVVTFGKHPIRGFSDLNNALEYIRTSNYIAWTP